MQNIPDIIKNLLKRNLTLEEVNFLLTSKDKNIQHLKTNLRIIMENADKKGKGKTKGRKKRAKSSKKDKDMTEERFTKIISNALAPIYLQIKDLRKVVDENKADTDRQITSLINDVATIKNDVGSLKKDMKIANKHLKKIDSRIDNLVRKNNLKE